MMHALLIVSDVIAIAINVVKGGDLILRPHQQKKLQEFIDDLALRLSFLRGRERLNEYIRGHRALFSAAVAMTSCMVLWERIDWPYASRSTIVASIALGSLVSAPTLIWILGIARPSRLLLGATIACATPLLFGVLLTLNLSEVIVEKGHKLAALSWPNITAYAIAASVAATTVPLLGCAIWLAALSICIVLLKVGTVTVWHIAEYNKGAWAGLMALLGVVLTILTVFVTGK